VHQAKLWIRKLAKSFKKVSLFMAYLLTWVARATITQHGFRYSIGHDAKLKNTKKSLKEFDDLMANKIKGWPRLGDIQNSPTKMEEVRSFLNRPKAEMTERLL
jgi:hypothetical protein